VIANVRATVGDVLRLHSDRGTEFCNQDLDEFCANHGIRKTQTQGYDPSANGVAELYVGQVKGLARTLLIQAKLATRWWGMACLAAGQLLRVRAGFGDVP
jgi:transposase InsO family protein